MISIEDAKEILAKEYYRANYLELVKCLIPDYKSEQYEINIPSKIFTQVRQLGVSQVCELNVFEVILSTNNQARRVAITQEMFRFLKSQQINNALVAFVNPNVENYRFSLLTSKYEFNGDKIIKVLSNPRRFSYELGKNAKTKTAFDYLIHRGAVSNLEELKQRFSIEVVNKQFYAEIATCYSKLVGGRREGKTYNRLLQIGSVTENKKYAEFAVRLIGRVMFCWFLKEKKSNNQNSLLPSDIFAVTTINQSANYYHDVLEPLFFEMLNTKQEHRKDKYAADHYYQQIPYLNGGLFSQHHDDHYKYAPATQAGTYGVVTIPNSWFVDFYNVLYQYNFTVDENTAYDIELSVDPEMLGRIFENLLAEINPETGENAKKSTGSFYTPREIVDYMVDSSLLEYLKEQTGIDGAKLKNLIEYGKDNELLTVFNDAEKKNLIGALYTITILDPACGSGAFPIGMLQKIVYILQEIDPDARMWFNKATGHLSPLLKKEFEKKFNAGSLDYIRKLSVILNSIFGVDIQPIAVEISRLRCFLSLIIEENVADDEPNRGIKPLPNLDFKFITANSLVGLDSDGQTSFFESQEHIEKLKEIRDEYFNAESGRRQELKAEFAVIQRDMLQNTVDNYQKRASMKYQQLSAWRPFDNESTPWFDPDWMFGIKEGFDIVIGNPPYLEARSGCFLEQLKDILQKQLQRFHGQNFNAISRGADLLIYFYELSLRLIKANGINVFITQNSWLDTEYGVKFQKYLLKNTNTIVVIDSDFKAFESANINTVITFFQGRTNKDAEVIFARCHESFFNYHFPIKENQQEDKQKVTVKRFKRDSDLLQSYKWGFLFNADENLVTLVVTLNKIGKTESQLTSLRIGQGLNLTKDYVINGNSCLISRDKLIPFLNVDEMGYYDWNTCNTYIVSNTNATKDDIQKLYMNKVKIFDEKGTKRVRPSLILPRGIGNKHFCSINSNKGYSSSCVDIYLINEEYLPELWIFMNSTLFWLMREASGRKSLGGGMLKSEAVDIKQFPLYFNFKNKSYIYQLIKETEHMKVLNAIQEIKTAHHKKIDNFIFNELNISHEMQCYIIDKFVTLFNERITKSRTK